MKLKSAKSIGFYSFVKMKNLEIVSQLIKQESKRLGFESCGIAKAEFLKDEASKLEQWLKNGYQGEMNYMENYFDKRLDPRLLVDGAKSVISLSFNYFPEEIQKKDTYKIAKYAFGEDYHFVLKAKLKELLFFIQEKVGTINGRVFVDSAPVLERVWAEKAGLGWRGKNSLLLQKSSGSFYFLTEIIIDLELDYDEQFITNHCGTCRKCIDACPTQAILSNNTVNGSKCISYFTIELKNEIPSSFKNKFEDWMFGCDICQDVCPWNRFSKPTIEQKFKPDYKLLEMNKRDWEEITQEVFQQLFKKSAVKRAKYTGLLRNINFLKSL